MMLSKGLVLTQLPMKMMMLSNIYIYIYISDHCLPTATGIVTGQTQCIDQGTWKSDLPSYPSRARIYCSTSSGAPMAILFASDSFTVQNYAVCLLSGGFRRSRSSVKQYQIIQQFCGTLWNILWNVWNI